MTLEAAIATTLAAGWELALRTTRRLSDPPTLTPLWTCELRWGKEFHLWKYGAGDTPLAALAAAHAYIRPATQRELTAADLFGD